MIQQKDFKNEDVKIIGERSESIEMGVDADSMQHLMMILSTNLYQNPIGSIVREYTSNAVDANTEGKNDSPVIVSLKNLSGNWSFEVRDFGPGLDDVDFRNTISKYGKSTKRDKEDQLGFYGLGCKSAFSYNNSFYYTCIKNGMERKYLLYKNSTGFNIDLLFETACDKPSGVMVSIPVKSYDQSSFFKEIKNQLAYFDNVYFDIDPTYENLNQTFSIFSEKDFHWSTICGINEMHITLGKVNYPIDWNAIGIQKITVPIGLKFGLDSGLFPIPNRENLIWSDTTKELVLNKIKTVSDWLVNKYNSELTEKENITEAWDLIGNHNYNLTLAGKMFNITNVYSTISFDEVKIKGITLRKPSFYKAKLIYLVDQLRLVGVRSYHALSTKNLYSYDSDFINYKKQIVLIDDINITGFFRDYLKMKNYKRIYKFKLPHNMPAWDEADYISKLGIKDMKTEGDVVKEFENVRQSFLDNTLVDGRSILDSKEYLEFKEANKAKMKAKSKDGLNKQKGHVTIAYSRPKYNGGYMFEKKVYDLENLYKNRFVTCYLTDEESQSIVIKAFLKQNVKLCTIGVQDLKKINQLKLKNIMSLKDLEKTKIFKKVVTGIRAKRVIETFDKLYKYQMPIIDNCLDKTRKIYDTVKFYAKDNIEEHLSDTCSVMLYTAEQYNLWDYSILDKVIALEKAVVDFEFITLMKPVERMTIAEKEKQEKFITSMLLFKKLKFENKLENLELCVKNEVPLDETKLTNKITENETI